MTPSALTSGTLSVSTARLAKLDEKIDALKENRALVHAHIVAITLRDAAWSRRRAAGETLEQIAATEGVTKQWISLALLDRS